MVRLLPASPTPGHPAPLPSLETCSKLPVRTAGHHRLSGRLPPRGPKLLFCTCALCSPPLRWDRGRPGHGLRGRRSEPGARPPRLYRARPVAV